LAQLFAAARAGRLPHALLFEGRAGIGKFGAAQWLALGLLCARGPGEPCGACGPCRRVQSGGERGNHADLFLVDPLLEGEERIRVGRIAERSEREEGESEPSLAAFLALKPLEGARRVVLVREVHRMNAQAQNAFLKTLEEPRPGTLMVLETHRPAALLSTLKSRCIRLRFAPLGSDDCARVLLAAGLEEDVARELARMADGSPGVALAMAVNGTRELHAALVALARGERDAPAVAADVWALEAEFAGKSDNAQARERVRVALDLAQLLARDALRHASGVPADALAFADGASVLARRLGGAQLVRLGLELARARADVERNLTPAAVLERALLALGYGPLVGSR
jgi:DNA polymerase-3 subunit delta'